MKRRDLFRQILVGGTVFLIAPATFTSCEEDNNLDPGGNNNNNNNNNDPLVIDLTSAQNAALGTVGGYIVRSGVIIINMGSDTFIALSSICTHAGSTVSYNNSAGNIQCPAHNSVFNTSGSVLSGPASSPLAKYVVSKTGNTLTITR